MKEQIETATRCGCGASITVAEAFPGGWFAFCHQCYDGTEDAAETEHCHGFGDTPGDALWAWAESHEDALQVAWEPVTLWGELEAQVADEGAAQRDWQRTDAPDGAINYGPPCAAETGEKHV